MASRKALKKEIKNICSGMMADSMALGLCEGADGDKYCGLMAETLALCADFVSRLSHTEKGKEREFYKKLREEFSQKSKTLAEEIYKA